MGQSRISYEVQFMDSDSFFPIGIHTKIDGKQVSTEFARNLDDVKEYIEDQTLRLAEIEKGSKNKGKLIRKDRTTMFYKSNIMGGTQSEHEDFYKFLRILKDNASDVTHAYNGNYYSNFTYTLPDGGKYVYTENDEYGIPYSIECLMPSKEYDMAKHHDAEEVTEGAELEFA